eukprot:COSAG06_NODE_404_length_16134_cov_88.503336_3_plen_173_part_00
MKYVFLRVAALEARDLTPYLKEAAEGLRRQTAEHNMRDDPPLGGGSDEEDHGWVATATDSVSTTTTDQREGTQMDLVPPRQVDTARFEQQPEPEPEPASSSFWKFGSAAADAEAVAPKSIDVYGPALAQLTQMVAEMQRGQREVTNRLNSQAEELARANRILDRVDKHTKRT